MKKLALLLMLSTVQPHAWADLQAGSVAYDRQDYVTAFREWLPLAQAGNARLQFILGTMYANGTGVPKSDIEAVRWYQQAAANGFADAQNNLALAYAQGQGITKDEEKAVEWWLLAAHQQQSNAQYNLAVMYERGQGTPRSDTEAAKWYQQAAAQGHQKAQNNLKVMYASGRAVAPIVTDSPKPAQIISQPAQLTSPKDSLIGFDRARSAAERGDYATALTAWTELAENGHAQAQYRLGLLYRKGQGVNKNDQAAAKWWQLSASQGDAEAQFGLSNLYATGEGVLKSESQAVKLLQQAAIQGHAAAQTSLGVKYATGRGVPKSDAEATRWWRLAARQGNAGAQLGLGAAYEYGIGAVPQHKVAAYALYNLAAANDMTDMSASKSRDRLEAALTVSERQAGQTLSIRLQQSDDFLRILDQAVKQKSGK